MDVKIIDDVNNVECDVLIINKFEDKETANSLFNEFSGSDFEGKNGQMYLLHTQNRLSAKQILAVGFGKEEKVNNDVIRENTAKAIKKCAHMKAKSVGISYTTDYNYGAPAILGAEIANYHFDKYKNKKENRVETIYLSNIDNDLANRAVVIAEGMELARNLANEPASYATPTKLAQVAESIEGIETEVFNYEKIEELGMGAFLGVAKGSFEPPKFIHMKYIPQNPKKRIAIIGKGLCFDSGGLDIKPASSMLNMKDDMSGAACVLGVMRTIAKLHPEIEVHGLIAACENMPSGTSYKPGDILTAMNGKTIEVDNTDAEGRLTLADALCYACKLEVDEVIDIATLTGACMVALGSVASGIMGNDDEFVGEIIKIGKEVGEKYWQLPMWQEYRDNMDSDVADMKNTGTRYGGASAAGMFLKEFVSDNIKWAHLDVAGTAFLEKPQKEFSKGACAAGLRTLVKYIISQ